MIPEQQKEQYLILVEEVDRIAEPLPFASTWPAMHLGSEPPVYIATDGSHAHFPVSAACISLTEVHLLMHGFDAADKTQTHWHRLHPLLPVSQPILSSVSLVSEMTRKLAATAVTVPTTMKFGGLPHSARFSTVLI